MVQHVPMTQDDRATSRDVGERAANVLGPESSMFEDLDAAGFGDAVGKVIRSGLTNPFTSGLAAMRLATDLARIPLVTAAAGLGPELPSPVAVAPKDRRFADPAWTNNPVFQSVRLSYLATCRAAREVVAGAALDEETERKASAAMDLMLDALAPTNFLMTN